MRRTRDGAMRHKALALGTRDRRPRFTPTKNRHAALHPQPGATRAYQSDSSSKPASSSAFSPLPQKINRPPPTPPLDTSVHISAAILAASSFRMPRVCARRYTAPTQILNATRPFEKAALRGTRQRPRGLTKG